jgi:two-component system, chemotaxis family, protein-glutamate methylesterase/glutaminase
MEKIRVLVVEDSLTIRRHVVEILEAAPDMEVVGEAADGKTAFELCRSLRPSVVTMDMMLDGSSGLFATEQIMAFCPTPILIVSASTNRGELFRTYDALKAGAVDVLEKPLGVEPSDAWGEQLKKTVRLISRIRVITHPRARLTLSSPSHASPRSSRWELVAIGASTGGPGAAIEVLRALPADFPLPVLLVIHISAAFASALAEWLATQIAVPVRHARQGEPLPRSGCVLMPPPDRHLEVRGGRLSLGDGPEVHFCRPSVDVLFESLARELGARTLACLLTGMGRDGASGLLAIKNSGGMTIAQDEATSVVFGMPGEAVRLGAAEHVLPLHEIGPRIAREVP